MRKFLAAALAALALTFGASMLSRAGDTDPTLLHDATRQKSIPFRFTSVGDGSGDYTSIAQVKAQRFHSYLIDIDMTAERTGGTSTDDDVHQAAAMHCSSLYTYKTADFSAPGNDAQGGGSDSDDKNENGCQYPITKLCDNSPCIWNVNRSRSNLFHYELTNQGDIDIQIEEPPTKHKVIVFTGMINVTDIPDLTRYAGPAPAVPVFDLARNRTALTAYTVTTNNSQKNLFEVKTERDTSYVVDVDIFAQYISGDSDATLLNQISEVNCQAVYDFSDGGSFGQAGVLCSYPRRHRCIAGQCVWDASEDVFNQQPPTFTLDGSKIAVQVVGSESVRTVVWFAKAKVRPTTIHVQTTTTTTSSTTSTTL
jgi:hypothetical protein